MRAGFGAFFQHHDRNVLAFLGRQLFDADGRGQAAGATAHDHHVVLHRLAGAELGQDFFVGHFVFRIVK